MLLSIRSRAKYTTTTIINNYNQLNRLKYNTNQSIISSTASLSVANRLFTNTTTNTNTIQSNTNTTNKLPPAVSTVLSNNSIPIIDPSINNNSNNKLNSEWPEYYYDPLYEIKAGIIVERLPKYLSRPEEWEMEYELFNERRELYTSPPIPTELISPTYESRIAAEKLLPYLDRNKTPDDIANNTKSLNRAVSESLYLIVKKQRSKHQWQFPQGKWEGKLIEKPVVKADSTAGTATATGNKSKSNKSSSSTAAVIGIEGESLKNTAERELSEECGKELRVFTLGNAPVGAHSYLYFDPKSKQGKKQAAAMAAAAAASTTDPSSATPNPYIGSRVFLYHAIYLGGPVQIDRREIIDYAWVTKSQLPEYIESKELITIANDTVMYI